MKVLKSLLNYAGKYKYLTLLSLLFSAISAVISLMPFIYIWKVINEIIEVYPNYEKAIHVTHYGLMAFLMAVIGILLYVLALLCSHLSAFRIANNMRKEAMNHVVRLPMGYLETQGSGKIRKTIDEASSSTETYLAHQLPDMVQMVITTLSIFILLFVFDWKFAVATLIPLILALLNMFKMVGKDLEKSMKEYMDALDAMSNEAVEYVRGIPVVKTFQQTVYSFQRFYQTIKDYEKFAIGYTNKMRIPMTAFTTWVNSIFIFLIGLVMLMALNGFDLKQHIPDFLFYVIFTPIVAVTTNKIMFASENTMLAKDAVARIHSITDLKPFVYNDNSKKLDHYDITFNHVSFHYPEQEMNVLEDIQLHIPEGKTVAFVGPSGGGKSTLVSLIPRFYDVNKGSIKIGQQDIRQLSEQTLMNSISFVFQDSHLLKRSIYENIKMGTNATKEEVLEALKQAQCLDIIEKFPDGIDTIIGSQGVYVSGGEAQRLMVARAILKNAPILLLDEASAYADPDNEVMMQKALSKLSDGKTTIMIAHHLSTIQNVDCIYVLDQGKIIEYGTHTDLINKKGLYSKMWNDYCQSVDWQINKEEDCL